MSKMNRISEYDKIKAMSKATMMIALFNKIGISSSEISTKLALRLLYESLKIDVDKLSEEAALKEVGLILDVICSEVELEIAELDL